MIDKTLFNEMLEIKENFEMPTKLLEILSDKERREALFSAVLEHTEDLGHDVLRDYFQDENGDRKALKQDYTPDCVCEIVNRISGNPQTVYDMCAGSGALTISKWQADKDAIFYCDEYSANVLPVLLLNLAMRNMDAVVRRRDVLTQETGQCWKLSRGEKFSNIEEVENIPIERTKLVITNPPYSLSFPGMEQLANDPRFSEYGLPPKSKADYAFILNGLSELEDGGEMFAILPHGVLFRGAREAEIRKKLIENNLIDALIGLPGKLFANTCIPVFILILKKNRVGKDVLFINAEKDFEAHGKQNIMTQEHIEKLASVYRNRLAVERYSRVVDFKEIEKNEFNLNLARYVDTSEPPEPIDINKEISDLLKIEAEITETRQKIIGTMEQLVSTDDGGKCDVADTLQSHYQAYTMKTLYDVGTVERMQVGKTYPAGTILIILSAIGHNPEPVKYCRQATEGNGRFAAVVVDSRYNSKYIYHSICNVFEDFRRKYVTTINLQFGALKHLTFYVHDDRQTQDSIAAELDLRQMEIAREQQQLEEWKRIKKYFLEKMFV